MRFFMCAVRWFAKFFVCCAGALYALGLSASSESVGGDRGGYTEIFRYALPKNDHGFLPECFAVLPGWRFMAFAHIARDPLQVWSWGMNQKEEWRQVVTMFGSRPSLLSPLGTFVADTGYPLYWMNAIWRIAP